MHLVKLVYILPTQISVSSHMYMIVFQHCKGSCSGRLWRFALRQSTSSFRLQEASRGHSSDVGDMCEWHHMILSLVMKRQWGSFLWDHGYRRRENLTVREDWRKWFTYVYTIFHQNLQPCYRLMKLTGKEHFGRRHVCWSPSTYNTPPSKHVNAHLLALCTKDKHVSVLIQFASDIQWSRPCLLQSGIRGFKRSMSILSRRCSIYICVTEPSE